MNIEQHVEEQFAHYLRLCKQEAWKAWAWHQVKQMANAYPSIYGKLPDRITKAMKEKDA